MDRIRCATTVSFQNGTPADRTGCRFHVKHIRVNRKRRPRSTWVASPDAPLHRSGRLPSQRIRCRHHRRSEPERSTAAAGCRHRERRPHRPLRRGRPLHLGLPPSPHPARLEHRRRRLRARGPRPAVGRPRPAVRDPGPSLVRRPVFRLTFPSRPVWQTSGWSRDGMVVRARFVRRQTGELTEAHRRSGRRRHRDRIPRPILRRAT